NRLGWSPARSGKRHGPRPLTNTWRSPGRRRSARPAPTQLATNFMNAIDTNVWLYSHDTRDPRKQGIAQQLIAATRPLALPWQVGCEFVGASKKLATVGL